MKLYPRRGGNGYIGNYVVSIGSAEARRVGFLTDEGKSRELTKDINEAAQEITIKLAHRESDGGTE
ncbi:hypothetical protein AGMMS49992_20280 [Clostridia bacterium]|nr:hypothetical protein AGMMS49992_20280 [Clostridia bacterium]